MTETFKHFMSQEESLKYIKDIGFDVADITLMDESFCRLPDKDIFDGDYIKRAHEIREFADKIGLPIVQAHAPYPIHVDNDEKYDQAMMEILKKCFVVCGILGVKYLVVHPWNNWDYKQNAVFFRKLLPFAKEHHVVICTENMWNWDYQNNHASEAACSSPEDFLKHIEEVNDDYLQACVDVGHANMMSMANKTTSPGNMVRVLNNHVKCFHIHDNNGVNDSHEVPFTMTLDWEDLAKSIKEIKYDGDLIMEVCDFEGRTLEQTIERNKKLIKAARKLVSLIESQ